MKKKTKEFATKLYDLELGETLNVKSKSVIERVAGGWIYHYPNRCVFVPFSKEFMAKKKAGEKGEDNILKYSKDFKKFWKKYPRKKGKGKAYGSWEKINPSEKTLARMLKAIEEQKKEWKKEDNKFIPHPTTWLNQSRWDDEIDEDIVEEKKGVKKYGKNLHKN